MSKLTDTYLLTTMEDENGGEIDIRVYYDYSPAKPMGYVDGPSPYPGCFAKVTVGLVEERKQYNLDAWAWFECFDYEESQAQDWEEEIVTLINAKENDDEHN